MYETVLEIEQIQCLCSADTGSPRPDNRPRRQRRRRSETLAKVSYHKEHIQLWVQKYRSQLICSNEYNSHHLWTILYQKLFSTSCSLKEILQTCNNSAIEIRSVRVRKFIILQITCQIQ